MSTYAILTVGYNDFLLPSAAAQKCFEVLSGCACETNYVGGDDAAAAGTTRGETIKPIDVRVQCRLLTAEDMHDALDRAKAVTEHKEGQRAAYLASSDAA